MNSPESLREFARQLVCRGLPVDYARRAAKELADHYHDLTDELRDAGMEEASAIAAAADRLGDAKLLVRKTVREYQRRHWCARWPLLTFLIGPVALMVAAWIATFLGMFVLGKALEAIGRPIPESSRQLSALGLVVLYAGVGWCLLVVPAGVAILLARWAHRGSVSRAWVVLSATILGLSAGFVHCGFAQNAANLEHPFMVTLPVWLPFQSPSAIMSWYGRSIQQLAQTFTPLLVAGLLLALNWRRRNQSARALLKC